MIVYKLQQLITPARLTSAPASLVCVYKIKADFAGGARSARSPGLKMYTVIK
jgi:hypothetical protein